MSRLPQILEALIPELAALLVPHVTPQVAAALGAVSQAAGAVAQQGGFGAAAQQSAFGGQPQQAQTGFGAAPQQAANPFGAAPQQTQAPVVTPDMIQQLITPLVQNEAIKQQLTVQMQQMGIQNLPDARPDQLPELYQRFQTVQQQAQAAGLLGGGTANPSLI